MFKTAALITCTAAFLLSSFAQADTITTFTLNADGCSAGCGNGNGTTNNDFGTVKLDDNNAGAVTVTVTLTGTEFVNSSGKEALAFDLPMLAGLSISLADPTDFSNAGAGSYQMPPFGNGSQFDEAIHCSACGSGASSPQAGPLIFTVTASGGVTTADFTANGNGFFFASDVIGTSSGNTGDVAASGPAAISTVPEPDTGLLFAAVGLGLFGFGRLYQGRGPMNRRKG